MKYIGAELDRYNGVGPGFDFVRILLSCTIVINHVAHLTGNRWIINSPLWIIEYSLVPMFFALSGFLVSGSALRLTLSNFLINRGLRIVPALAVDIFFCALIIGPLLTKVGLIEYFTHPDFFRYFLNIVGWIHYDLPGLFYDNPTNRVNGSLWTVPFEIACYIVMSGFMVFGIIRRRMLVALATAIFLCVGIISQVAIADGIVTGLVAKIANFFFVSRGAQLVAAFMMGILMYQFRYNIYYSKKLVLISFTVVLVGAYILNIESVSSVYNRFIMLPAIVYITIWLGVTPVSIPNLFHRGDYSYGIYLYHYPLAQVIIALLPISILTNSGGFLMVSAFTIISVSAFSAFSWHYIEKPVLGLRRKFSFVAQVRGVATVDKAGVNQVPLSEGRQQRATLTSGFHPDPDERAGVTSPLL